MFQPPLQQPSIFGLASPDELEEQNCVDNGGFWVDGMCTGGVRPIYDDSLDIKCRTMGGEYNYTTGECYMPPNVIDCPDGQAPINGVCSDMVIREPSLSDVRRADCSRTGGQWLNDKCTKVTTATPEPVLTAGEKATQAVKDHPMIALGLLLGVGYLLFKD